MAKRGNTEGSIYKRQDGRWVAALTMPDGKRRNLYGKTRKEAGSKLAEAIHDRGKGLPVIPERQTVEDFLLIWLEGVKPSIRPSTFTRYEEYVRLHTIPIIGKVRMAKLNPQHIQSLYNQKLSEGLSATTVRHLHTVLHRSLDQAMRWKLIARNVTEDVDPPRRTSPEFQALTTPQVKQLLRAAHGDPLEALYVLAIITGLRRGELLGLRWNDIDLIEGNLRVRSTLLKGGVLGEPKTAKGRRQIALPDIAVDALKNHRILQLRDQYEAGPTWIENDLVFTNSIGQHVDPDNLRNRSFIPLLQKAGLPYIRFHDLRHTAATLLLGLGANPKIVQEVLGHSQISITMDVYSHVLPTMQRATMSDMNKLLSS